MTNSKVAYLRLHGRNAKAYVTGKTVAARFDYDYSEKEIAEVAERSRKLAKEAREVHVIFNNNNLDYAPRAALRLRKALGQIVRCTGGDTGVVLAASNSGQSNVQRSTPNQGRILQLRIDARDSGHSMCGVPRSRCFGAFSANIG